MFPSSNVGLSTRRCLRGSAGLCPRRFVTEDLGVQAITEDLGDLALTEDQAQASPEVLDLQDLETEVQDSERWRRMLSFCLRKKLKQSRSQKML